MLYVFEYCYMFWCLVSSLVVFWSSWAQCWSLWPMVRISWFERFQIMLRNFPNLIALPVPLLRQVFLDLSDIAFSRVFLMLFIKKQDFSCSGSTFSRVFLMFDGKR